MNSSSLRLCAGYFAYFGAVGIFAPFWSPYLALRGFSALEIGVLIAVVAAARSVSPIGFGWLADATQRPTMVLRIAAGLAAASFALLPLQSGLAGFVALSVCFGVFWNSVIPLYDAHTLSHLGAASARYGRLRLWGSVGFIVFSWAGGVWFGRVGYEQVPLLILGLTAATFVATLAISPMPARATPASSGRFGVALRSRAVIVALLVSALVIMSFGPYYAFFSLWLERHGYDQATIGLLWALGVAAEIGVFALGQSLLARFSIRMLFIAAAVGTALRWLVVALLVASPVALALSQLLHCLGFAVLHFATVLTAQRAFPRGLESSGQSLFSAVVYGVGGLLGSLLAGVIWTTFSPQASYVCAVFIVVLAALCAAVGLRGTALDRDFHQGYRES